MLIPQICFKKSGDKGKEAPLEYMEQREPEVSTRNYIGSSMLYWFNQICFKKSGDNGKEVSSEYMEKREPEVSTCCSRP
jgi:hypothetical protein